jgi:transposase-like protein
LAQWIYSLKGFTSVSWKTRKEVAAALKSIYACTTVEQASQAMDEFCSSSNGLRQMG